MPATDHFHYADSHYDATDEPSEGADVYDQPAIPTFREAVHLLVTNIRRDVRESDCVLQQITHSGVLRSQVGLDYIGDTRWIDGVTWDTDPDRARDGGRFYTVLPCGDQDCLPAAAKPLSVLVASLEDGDVFSTDGGRTWHTCAVVLFGNVAVYATDQRGDDAPTVRIDAPRHARVLVR
jgi:hypothetical protein